LRHIVGVADMRITTEKDDIIVTHALGSCLGITVYDPVACVGGMLHVMLPQSTIDQNKAAQNPCMFVDTGVPKLFIDCYKLGASKPRLVVKAAGGACVSGAPDHDFFHIGQRNFTMLRKLLWKNGVLLESHEVGGNESRTLSLDMGSGEVIIKSNGEVRSL
jgi:chemotaxis protein CheD